MSHLAGICNSVMDLDVVVKSEALSVDCMSSENSSLTATSVDSKSGLELSSASALATKDEQQTSLQESSTADHEADAITVPSEGLVPTAVAATTKVVESTAGPIKLVIAANSVQPVLPPKASTSTQVNSPASAIGQPSLLVAPAVTTPICVTSPRRTVTVLPANMRSPSQGLTAVVNARPLTAAAPTVNLAAQSPSKVTVLSLPKTSSVPGQFVTIIPNSNPAVTASDSKTTAMPYKVLIRPPSAVSV